VAPKTVRCLAFCSAFNKFNYRCSPSTPVCYVSPWQPF